MRTDFYPSDNVLQIVLNTFCSFLPTSLVSVVGWLAIVVRFLSSSDVSFLGELAVMGRFICGSYMSSETSKLGSNKSHILKIFFPLRF